MASDVAVSISGTAVLELAMAKIPTVVAYKVSSLTYNIAKHFVKIKNVTLPNIIAGKTIVPEFIQDKCNAQNLSKAVIKCIDDKKYRQKMIDGLDGVYKAMKKISGKSASDTAANAVIDMLFGK